MQTTNRVLEDLAKVANGAVSTLVGIKAELEAMVRQQAERLLAGLDLISREEFEAVRAMAAKARTEQEKLEKRVAALEARLATTSAGAGTRRAAAKSKAARPRRR